MPFLLLPSSQGRQGRRADPFLPLNPSSPQLNSLSTRGANEEKSLLRELLLLHAEHAHESSWSSSSGKAKKENEKGLTKKKKEGGREKKHCQPKKKKKKNRQSGKTVPFPRIQSTFTTTNGHRLLSGWVLVCFRCYSCFCSGTVGPPSSSRRAVPRLPHPDARLYGLVLRAEHGNSFLDFSSHSWTELFLPTGPPLSIKRWSEPYPLPPHSLSVLFSFQTQLECMYNIRLMGLLPDIIARS